VPYAHPVAVASSAFWWGLYFGCFGASVGALLGKWVKRILRNSSRKVGAVDTWGASDDAVGSSGSPQDAGRASAESTEKIALLSPLAKWPRYVPVPPTAEIIERMKG
jgi:hypothetical protein